MYFHKKHFLKAAFNSANLGGLGGTLLSVSLGNVFGAGIFIGAIALGTYNKYRALSPIQNSGPENWLAHQIHRPDVTAISLMSGAAINCSGEALSAIMAPEERALHVVSALMWGTGGSYNKTCRLI